MPVLLSTSPLFPLTRRGLRPWACAGLVEVGWSVGWASVINPQLSQSPIFSGTLLRPSSQLEWRGGRSLSSKPNPTSHTHPISGIIFFLLSSNDAYHGHPELSPAPPTSGAGDKATYLNALRKSINTAQENINKELTARMEEDKVKEATRNGAAPTLEEENYGEEAPPNDD
ncbi:GON7 family protein [Colletotrichum tofieldiae]|nr:GON7 family protein [Colletotrichum tofieldiae]